jgi:hypothetical protein
MYKLNPYTLKAKLKRIAIIYFIAAIAWLCVDVVVFNVTLIPLFHLVLIGIILSLGVVFFVAFLFVKDPNTTPGKFIIGPDGVHRKLRR